MATTVPPARLVSRTAGSLAIAVGAMVLTGWVLDNDILKGAGGTITMKANAALGLLACGLSLRLFVRPERTAAILSTAAAVFAGLLGLATLSEHVIGWDLGIDQLLFEEPPGALATTSPGRMGINGSLSLALAAIALLTLRRRPVLSQMLACVMAVVATVAVVGYWYGAQELYGIARYTGIAWPTAVTLLALSIGILLARPDARPVAAILGEGPGGMMARAMMIPAVVVPLILGYARVQGQQANVFDTGLGTALFAVLVVVLFSALIWRTAITLDDSHRARDAVQRERDELLIKEQAARENAERANRVKDEFLAALSHELRTPLNAIVGWTEMLRSEVVPAERRAHAAEVVARNGRFLARLIEDLLDVSRFATGQMRLTLQPVDVMTVAARAIDAIDSSARKKGIHLHTRLDAKVTVAGDPERLQQILVNLLSNAVKFTPALGTVEVIARVNASHVEVAVRDSGQGIRADLLPHVFERFRQGDSTATREHGGLGLGLSIARELAELHGGTVSAFSAGEGRGATFTVTLPILERAGAVSVQ